MINDLLEGSGPLTKWDFEFLKGNEPFWDIKGAAYNVVSEWCRNHGFGNFGEPTELGKKMMLLYLKRVQ